MLVELVPLPQLLKPHHLAGRAVVVLAGKSILMSTTNGVGRLDWRRRRLAALNRLTSIKLACDSAGIASALFESSRNSLPQTLRDTRGGRNVVAAGLGAEIDFAARLNVINHVPAIDPATLIVTRATGV